MYLYLGWCSRQLARGELYLDCSNIPLTNVRMQFHAWSEQSMNHLRSCALSRSIIEKFLQQLGALEWTQWSKELYIRASMTQCLCLCNQDHLCTHGRYVQYDLSAS